MRFSISCRIAEGFLSKEEAMMALPDLCELAVATGYDGICMRASQIGVHSPVVDVIRANQIIQQHGLSVTMITGDFDIVYNNDRGPNCLNDITPYLNLADVLGSSLVRVCIRKETDLALAQRAADEAAERNITLVHQCHVQSLFETVDQIESCLRRIDRPNFGLIFEAANLEECGQDYGAGTIARLAPWIRNVYLQNQRIKPDGEITLDTWTCGPVSFDIIGIPEPDGIDFGRVFKGLAEAGYDGIITVHQSAPQDDTSAMEAASGTREFLKTLV